MYEYAERLVIAIFIAITKGNYREGKTKNANIILEMVKYKTDYLNHPAMNDE